MSATAVSGSFVQPPTHSNIATAGLQVSSPLQAESGFKLTLTGLDANNRVKTQRSDDHGQTWTDDTTYNADQAAITIAGGTLRRQYRLNLVQIQAGKVLTYRMERT